MGSRGRYSDKSYPPPYSYLDTSYGDAIGMVMDTNGYPLRMVPNNTQQHAQGFAFEEKSPIQRVGMSTPLLMFVSCRYPG